MKQNVCFGPRLDRRSVIALEAFVLIEVASTNPGERGEAAAGRPRVYVRRPQMRSTK